MESTELLVIGFMAIGGVVTLLPLLIVKRVGPVSVLKMIGSVLLVSIAIAGFYASISDCSVGEVFRLKCHPAGWPLRAVSVPYILAAALSVVLPVVIIASVVRRSKGKPNKAIQATPKNGAPEL